MFRILNKKQSLYAGVFIIALTCIVALRCGSNVQGQTQSQAQSGTEWQILSQAFENPVASFWSFQFEAIAAPSVGKSFTKTFELPHPVTTNLVQVSIRYRNADLILWILRDQDGEPILTDIRQGEGNPAMWQLKASGKRITQITFEGQATRNGEIEFIVKGAE